MKKLFLWGAATSAPQTESFSLSDNKSASTWEYWYQIEPDKFYQHNSSNDTNDTYIKFLDDIECINEIGLNSYRTSISWTRLIPDGININEKAVNYYLEFFKAIKRQKIKLFVNLFHFDLPMWMMEKGGWTNRIIIDHFSFYAKTCFQLFGEYVDYWITFNEPTVHVECSYLSGHHFPAIKDWSKMIQAGYHTLLAHAKAVQIFRKLKIQSQIGIVLILSPVYAASKNSDDLIAQKNAELLYIKSFLDPCIFGKINLDLKNLLKKHNLLCDVNELDYKLIQYAVIDFIGANYYKPIRVKKVNSLNSLYYPFFELYDWKQKRVNKWRDWEIFPEGIYDLAINLKKNYNNISWYLSENGIGVGDEDRHKINGVIQDDYRINFIQEHLFYLKKAINDGANCFGYHTWTLIDCWSWLNGYKNRYGLYELNLLTKDRRIKKSGIWLKKFIGENKF